MSEFTYLVQEEHVDVMGQYYDWTNPDNPPGGVYSGRSFLRAGCNFSENHKRSRDGKYRTGGPWLMRKRTTTWSGDFATTYRSGLGKAYVGAYYMTDQDDLLGASAWDTGYFGTDPNTEETTENTMSYGAQAYAALKPDLPDFSPVVALAELRSAPRALQLRFKQMFRRMRRHRRYSVMNRLGRYHLALQFGWLPLFRDTLSFVRAFANRKKRFKQMLRDEGRGVRRRRYLAFEGNDRNGNGSSIFNRTYTTNNHPALRPLHVSQCYGGPKATSTVMKRYHLNVWCAGKSHYVLPPGPRDDGWKANMERRILGLQLSPSAVYNVIPWTWLEGYFSTLGNMFDAISDNIADRVWFDYAYIMREKELTIESIGTQGVYQSKNGAGSAITARRLKVEVLKCRLGASPFGFGLTEGDLSPGQAGILAALGGTMM